VLWRCAENCPYRIIKRHLKGTSIGSVECFFLAFLGAVAMFGAKIHRVNTDNPEIAFLLARSSAIGMYASVEQALAALFAQLLRSKPDYAAVPFFRINNARARNAILERLLKKRYGSKYNLFWNSVVKELNILDGERNQVVHWAILTVYNHDRTKIVRLKLTPPNYWDRGPNTPKMSMEDIYQFGLKCVFIGRALIALAKVSSRKRTPKAWRDICRQPLSYPLPPGHPLNPTDTAWSPQPESSRA
jgi:hypothetical protein